MYIEEVHILSIIDLLMIDQWLTSVGILHSKILSILPGRNSAGSIRSGLLLAAKTYTPEIREGKKKERRRGRENMIIQHTTICGDSL